MLPNPTCFCMFKPNFTPLTSIRNWSGRQPSSKARPTPWIKLRSWVIRPNSRHIIAVNFAEFLKGLAICRALGGALGGWRLRCRDEKRILLCHALGARHSKFINCVAQDEVADTDCNFFYVPMKQIKILPRWKRSRYIDVDSEIKIG